MRLNKLLYNNLCSFDLFVTGSIDGYVRVYDRNKFILKD
jgi:hypothetical protein